VLGYIISRNFLSKVFCYELKEWAGVNFLRFCLKHVRGKTVQTTSGNICFLLEHVAECYKCFVIRVDLFLSFLIELVQNKLRVRNFSSPSCSSFDLTFFKL